MLFRFLIYILGKCNSLADSRLKKTTWCLHYQVVYTGSPDGALNPRSVFLFRLNLVMVQYETSCLIVRGCWLSGHWYGRRVHGIGIVADFYRTYPWNGVQIAWFASRTHSRIAIAIFWFVRSVAVLSRQFVSKPTDNEIRSGVQRCFSSAVIFSVQRSNA